MGSPAWEEGRLESETQHWVTLTRGFWICDHETTQDEYQSVMGFNPSEFTGANHPVETVTWSDAVTYCERLTSRERAAGRIASDEVYRLPTEAEWEYACRAGTTGANYGTLELIAWCFPFAGVPRPRDVMTLEPNPWGLYDMSGNVWEWCSDWYEWFSAEPATDSHGPEQGQYRVIRGGSVNTPERDTRSASRSGEGPGNRGWGQLGFRVVFSSSP